MSIFANLDNSNNNLLLNDLENRFGDIYTIRIKALDNDENLFAFLLEKSKYSDTFKAYFFKQAANNLIFLKDEFLKFLNLRLLSNSYTACANYIGLSFEKKQEKFIKTDGDVVLNFPFKDGVIKGGQTKDEQKLNEVFLNNILAKDEIDVLFTPKVISHFELISQQNSNQNSNQNSDYENLLQVLQNENPNLLIKGNNLIALHTLKYYLQQRKEKVKLIYIDPPYNTGNDSFNYNDKFNHSTWLCFMKNRLEIAKQLLSDDGVIFIQCDDNEQAYLKVLCDEIFGRENFVNTICWEKKGGRQNDAKYFSNNHEYILIYSKCINNIQINLLNRTEEQLKDYKNPDNDPRGVWTSSAMDAKSGSENSIYTITFSNGVSWEPAKGRFPAISKEKMLELYNDNRLWFGEKGTNKPRLKVFLTEVKNGITPNTLWFHKEVGNTQTAKQEIKELFNNSDYLFATPKPEALIQRIIEISTNENDLVLDFFAGSGTTLAVAHKMKRRYIGIEQMDYIQTITKQRLTKVIDGENGGISKSINWNGGGNFVYIELAELNAKFKQKINAVNDYNEFMLLAENLDSKAFLNYKLDNKNITEIISSDEFKNLNLDKQKQMLIACLDANMDYIPLQEIDDENYKFDAQVKQLNNAFYKINN